MRTILIVAAALAASAWTAPAFAQYGAGAGYGQGESGPGHAPYGYDDSTSALGRYCPAGLYPAPFPGGDGIRCEPVGGTTLFILPH